MERLVAHGQLSGGPYSEDQIEAMLIPVVDRHGSTAKNPIQERLEHMFTREGSFVDADGFMSRSSFVEAARILVHDFERERSGCTTLTSSEYAKWFGNTQGIRRERRPLPRHDTQAAWQRRSLAAAARDGKLFQFLMTYPLQVCCPACWKLTTQIVTRSLVSR